MTETDGRIRASIDLPSRPRSARTARRFVEDQLIAWGRHDLADAAALLTNELVTNSILHAGTDIVVEASRDPDSVRVEVSDLDGGPVARRGGALDDESGRGLELVDAMARAWGVEERSGGKTVWFEVGSD